MSVAKLHSSISAVVGCNKCCKQMDHHLDHSEQVATCTAFTHVASCCQPCLLGLRMVSLGTACSFKRCLPTSIAYSSDSGWIHTCRFVFLQTSIAYSSVSGCIHTCRFVFAAMLGCGLFSLGTACSCERCLPTLIPSLAAMHKAFVAG